MGLGATAQGLPSVPSTMLRRLLFPFLGRDGAGSACFSASSGTWCPRAAETTEQTLPPPLA